jgi:hypothetical protein
MHRPRGELVILQALMLSYCCDSLLSVSMETRAHVALVMHKYFYSSCVVLLDLEERGM